MGKMKDLILQVKELLDTGISPDEVCKRLNLDSETMNDIIAWLESDDMK
jgi:orotate phosphoribosyltransferase-like protein